MKQVLFYSIMTAGTLLAACGPTKSNPIEKYQKQGLVPASSPDAANKPQVVYKYVDKEVPVIKEVPKEIIKYVTKDAQQILIQGQVFQIDGKGAARFVEGKANAYEFTVRILQGKVKFNVNIANLPDGAKLSVIKEEINNGQYRLDWTPKVGTIAKTQNELDGEFQIQLANLEYVNDNKDQNDATKKAFDVMSKIKSISYNVRRTNEKPTFEIKGLSNTENRKEGEVHPFSIDVKAPGTSNGMAPEVVVSYDVTSPGNNPVKTSAKNAGEIETAGAYYITEASKNAIQFLGNDQWRFNYNFDTLNKKLIQMQLSSQNSANIDKQIHVQVTFQVNNSLNGTTSDKKTLRFSIDLNQKTATTAAAAGVTP